KDGVGEDVEPDEVARQGAHGEGCQRPEKDVRNKKDDARAEALEGARQNRGEAYAAEAERLPAERVACERGHCEADEEEEWLLHRPSGVPSEISGETIVQAGHQLLTEAAEQLEPRLRALRRRRDGVCRRWQDLQPGALEERHSSGQVLGVGHQEDPADRSRLEPPRDPCGLLSCRTRAGLGEDLLARHAEIARQLGGNLGLRRTAAERWAGEDDERGETRLVKLDALRDPVA